MMLHMNGIATSPRRPVAGLKCCGTALLILAVFVGCGKKLQKHTQTFFRMDTVTDVTVVLPDRSDPKPVWKSIDSLLLDWEERFSVTGEKSEVAILNSRVQQVMPVGRHLAAMIAFALRYGDTLDGGFDLTILPVKEVWGFGEKASDSMPLPTAAQVDSALAAVSYKGVRLNEKGDSVYFASPATRIDLGGIAKGFVLREIALALDRSAIDNYLAVAGGDVVGKGKRPDGKPWLIGIQHPRQPDSLLGTLPLDSGSVVTSGDYERFRIVDGKRYHHIFNSHTGQCCLANRSVTIYGADPGEVDVLSTGLFCRSAEEIVAYINKRPRFQCLVVDSTGTIFKSSGWRGKVMGIGK